MLGVDLLLLVAAKAAEQSKIAGRCVAVGASGPFPGMLPGEDWEGVGERGRGPACSGVAPLAGLRVGADDMAGRRIEASEVAGNATG